MSTRSQVLRMKFSAAIADVPADVMRDAVEVCKLIGVNLEIIEGVPSLEVLCAAAGILSEREKCR